MAAPDALHPEQLKLFMTAPEIKDRLTSSMDQAIGEDMPQMWDRKWRQSANSYESYEDEDDEGKFKGIGPSLRQSITEHGYQEQEPIHVVHLGTSDAGASLADAHHRVEVMSRLHPDQFLTVKHHASRYDQSTTGQWVNDYREARTKREREAWSQEEM